MPTVEDYVARIEGTCGAEKDLIVIFKYDKQTKAIDRILKKAQLRNSLAGIVFELAFNDVSFRVYKSGKAIFRGIKNRKQLNEILADLLL